MRRSLRFLPEVEEDALAAYAWYEGKAQGLGEEFRRCLLRRFPYAFYFRVDGADIVGFGLFHCARDPENIRAQLQRRGPMAPD